MASWQGLLQWQYNPFSVVFHRGRCLNNLIDVRNNSWRECMIHGISCYGFRVLFRHCCMHVWPLSVVQTSCSRMVYTRLGLQSAFSLAAEIWRHIMKMFNCIMWDIQLVVWLGSYVINWKHKYDIILFCTPLKNNDPFESKFCTSHDSSAVMACTNF